MTKDPSPWVWPLEVAPESPLARHLTSSVVSHNPWAIAYQDAVDYIAHEAEPLGLVRLE
jgi:hypothetical protein